MNTTTFIFAVSLASSLHAAVIAAPEPVVLPPGTIVLRDIPHVEKGHERQKLDLFLPEGHATPLQL